MSDGKNFIKNIGSLSIWNIASAFIGLASFYLITNILGPTEYGKYALAISIVTTISLAVYASVNESLLRFSAITKDKKLVILSAKIQYAFGIISMLILLVFSRQISNLYNKPIAAILSIVSLSLLFTPLIELTKNFSIGRKNIKNLVYVSLFSQLTMIFLISIIYFLGHGNAVLVSSFYILSLFISFLYALHILKKESYENDNKYNKKDIFNYIKGGFVFGFLKNIYFQAALLVGSKFVDITNVAYYTFSISIATVSIFAVINAIQTISVPYITSFYEEGKIEKVNSYFSASIKLGIIISLIFSFLLFIFLKITLKYLFPKYTPALYIMPFIFLAFVIINLNSPMSYLKAKGKIIILTKISIIATIFSLLNSYILSRMFDFKGMILSLIINISFGSALSWYYAYKELKIKFSLIPTKEEIYAFKLYSRQFLNKIFKRINSKLAEKFI